MLDIKMIVIRRTCHPRIPQAIMAKFSSCISLSEGMGGGGMVVLEHVVQKI